MNKKYSEHKDSEIAKDILISAIHLATETNHPRIQTELMDLEQDYNTTKMKSVRKILVGYAHKIFHTYGHSKDLDMSGSELVDVFNEYGLQDPK